MQAVVGKEIKLENIEPDMVAMCMLVQKHPYADHPHCVSSGYGINPRVYATIRSSIVGVHLDVR